MYLFYIFKTKKITNMKNALIASSSTIYGSAYLEYLYPELQILFNEANTILFIPFARPNGISHQEYTENVALAFQKIGKKIIGLHQFDDYQQAILAAEGIFTGGGNTFLLVSELYKHQLFDVLQTAIAQGTPYLGTSAGSNIVGLSMQTTNDMPIVYPPSFQTLGIIPFNLNPHYLDPVENGTHMGETRATRIAEFHQYNAIPVLGLREGSWLAVQGKNIVLKGPLTARLFEKNKTPIEIVPETNLNNLK